MIDFTKLQKDHERVKSALKFMDDGSIVAIKKVTVYFPKRFEDARLAEISDAVYTICMLGVVYEDCYTMMGAMAHVALRPGDVSEETIKNDRYYVLSFEPGDIVIENITVPQDSNITYSYYLEFLKYARIPWYATDDAIRAVFDEAGYYAGKAVGNTAAAVRVIYALTMRDPVNLDIPFRYSDNLSNPEVKPRIIGMNNPGQLLNSTFSRLSSGYMSDNIIAGILNPDEKVTTLEEVIRGLPSEVGDNSNVGNELW